MTDTEKKFADFIGIVKKLRSDGGCPWDREQTPLSLKRYFLEETGELLEAIDADDPGHIKEELGDILYLIILLAEIHSEAGFYGISDVVAAISAKMIRRHPHVFADEEINSVAELRQRWRLIKAGEKTGRNDPEKN